MTHEPTLYRVVPELEVRAGRTVDGLAIPWDKWRVVQEHHGGPPFPEAHMRSSFDESLRRDRGPRNVWSTHEYAANPFANPLGVVHFERGTEGLMFRAFLSKTRKADEELELIKDGAKTAVSIGFLPLKSRNVQRPEGVGRYRVESKLLELSIVPTGRGQYPESRILALRSEQTYDERTQLVCDAATAAVFGETQPEDAWLYIRDITDTWAVYEVHGSGVDEDARGMFRIAYTLGDEGTVTLEAPERVTVSYDYVESTRSIPAADQWLRLRAGMPPLKFDPPR